MHLLKKTMLTLAAFALVGACALGAGIVAGKDTGLPSRIAPESPCPATGCASGQCHGYENIPEPDGVHEMKCPETGCAAADCHGWEAVVNHARLASDASMNLWLVAPVVFVVSLLALLKALSRADGRTLKNPEDSGGTASDDVLQGGRGPRP